MEVFTQFWRLRGGGFEFRAFQPCLLVSIQNIQLIRPAEGPFHAEINNWHETK